MHDQHTQTTCDPGRQATTDGLRALADWLDAHPELQMPYQLREDNGIDLLIQVGSWDPVTKQPREDVSGDFARAVKALGGHRRTEHTEDSLDVVREFGPGVRVRIWTNRDEVCEAVVVGQETVEVEKVVTPAVVETVSEQRDIVEWRCTPVLDAAIGITEAREALAGAR